MGMYGGESGSRFGAIGVVRRVRCLQGWGCYVAVVLYGVLCSTLLFATLFWWLLGIAERGRWFHCCMRRWGSRGSGGGCYGGLSALWVHIRGRVSSALETCRGIFEPVACTPTSRSPCALPLSIRTSLPCTGNTWGVSRFRGSVVYNGPRLVRFEGGVAPLL